MRYKKLGNKYILRLKSGENVLDTIKEFLKEVDIKAGYLTGIGAVADPKLGYFNEETKGYDEKSFFGEYEMLSLNGNISLFEGEIFIHAHVVLGDKNFKAFGGHLIDANVGATNEIIIIPLEGELLRDKDREFGLKLLDLE